MPAVSEAAKRHQAEARKELIQWYKDAGLCIRCHTQYARPGRCHCEACAKFKREQVMHNRGLNIARCKERRERLKAEGRCERCGKKAVPGRVLCAVCARKNAESKQVTRIRRRLQKEVEHGYSNAT